MQPLVNNSKQSTKKNYWCYSICAISALFVIIAISCLAYFGTGTNLNSQSPAKNLIKQNKFDAIFSDNDDDNLESFYPTEVDFDPNRIIIKSDRSSTSEYYNEKGADDFVAEIPGLVKSTCSASPTNCGFKKYSGYLLANDNREIHYWFFQAETTPQKKPVFIWTNGGPGCSGADGLFTEQGPFKALPNKKVAYNPYTWITEVNMVFLEQPYGVGFSVPDDDDDVVGGDQNAADDMDAAVRDFIKKFPKFADNEFFMSSESWGGHYVPMTTYTMLTNNEDGVTPRINLKGFLLGNPSTDPYENKYGFVGGIYGHGMLPSEAWYTWRSKCWSNAYAISNNIVCAAIHAKAYYAAMNANLYGLDFNQCYADEDWGGLTQFDSPKFMKDAHIHESAQKSIKKVLDVQDYESLKMGHISKEDLQKLYDQVDARLNVKKKSIRKSKQSLLHAHNSGLQKFTLERDEADDIEEYLSYEPCIEHFMYDYLNTDYVQSAFNVKSTTWEMCSDDVWYAWPDDDFMRHIEPYYTQIVDKYVDKLQLTLTVYSGDDDSVCGLQGTQYWLDRWSAPVNSKVEWKQWRDPLTQQLAGYYTQYMTPKDNVGLHFLSVRTAGHMVPTTQPQRALALLKRFVNKFRSEWDDDDNDDDDDE